MRRTDDTDSGQASMDSPRVGDLKRAWQQFLEEWYVHLPLLVLIGLVVFPLLMVMMMSTQSIEQIRASQITIGTQLFENYYVALFEEDFLTYSQTSLVMSILIAVGKVILALLAAMALVYYAFPFQRALLVVLLLALLLPIPVLIVPMFELMSDLGQTNTMFALVVPYLASPTALLLLYQHFRAIPDSYIETAKLDDIGPIRFLVYVLVPMSKNMLIGLFIISFIWAWNQYLWPLVAAGETYTVVQVGLEGMTAEAAGETRWDIITAATMIALAPPVVLLLMARKQLLTTFNVQTK